MACRLKHCALAAVVFALAAGACRNGPAKKPVTVVPDAASDPEPSVEKLPATEPVEFTTEDGMLIRGVFYASKLRQANAKQADGAIVLVHQLSSDHKEWGPVIEGLIEKHSVLAIDMRGHGDSIFNNEGASVTWGDFGPAEWKNLPLDVRASVAYLRDLSPPPTAISLGGSSIGSSAVLLYAADDSEIHSVALVSPGLSYRGLKTSPAAAKMKGRSLLALATTGDQGAAKSATSLTRSAGSTQLKVYKGKGHGVTMDGTVTQDLVEFLKQTPSTAESE